MDSEFIIDRLETVTEQLEQLLMISTVTMTVAGLLLGTLLVGLFLRGVLHREL